MSRPAVPRRTSPRAVPVLFVTVGLGGESGEVDTAGMLSAASLSAMLASAPLERAEALTVTGPAATTASSTVTVAGGPMTSRLQTRGSTAPQPGPRSVFELRSVTFGENVNVTETPAALPPRLETAAVTTTALPTAAERFAVSVVMRSGAVVPPPAGGGGGGAVATVQVREAGVASALPLPSMARTANV